MRFLLAFAQGGLISPLIPLFRDVFHVTPAEVGLLTSMAGVSSVVMDVIATYLLSRRPLIHLLLQGIGLTIVALLASAMAPGFYWLIASQMLLGLGISLTRVTGLMVVVAATPRTEQGRANNLLEFSAIAGLTISPTLSGLAAVFLHWRLAFVLAAGFVAAAFAWVLASQKSLTRAVEAASGAPSQARATTPLTLDPPASGTPAGVVGVAYVATFVMSFVWSGFLSTALPLFGGEVVHLSPSTLGLVLTVGLLFDLLLLLPMGWLSDRLECRVVLAPALLLMGATLAWFPYTASLTTLLGVSIALHTGFAAWGMPSAALASCTPRHRLARVMGIYRLLVDGAVVIAPWLVGTLIGRYGYGVPSWLTALLAVITALLVAHRLRGRP